MIYYREGVHIITYACILKTLLIEIQKEILNIYSPSVISLSSIQHIPDAGDIKHS